MTRRDAGILDAAALAADYAEDLLVGTVRDVHGAVAGRFWCVGDRLSGGTSLVHRAHDGISGAVYSGLSAGLRASAAGLRAASSAGVGAGVEATPQGRLLTATINGLIGDRLREQGSSLAFDLGVRVAGRDVPVETEHLRAAYPTAGGDLVVFVHGLVENEASWERPARPKREVPDRRGYGARLAEEGWSPVQVRVNTGLPVAENGVALAALLQRLVEQWPTDVRRIALVGHSMGGLILRSACAVRTDSPSPWTELVTDLVLLGTPHLGAPLERVVDRGVRWLGVLPEAAPFGRILEYRSTGILDLRHGLARDVQNLPHARYRLVAATLTRSPRSVSAATLGDLLVPYDSALGRRRDGEEMFPGAETLHVPGADHFDLLHHDDVYAAIRAWLARDPADPSDPPTREESAAR